MTIYLIEEVKVNPFKIDNKGLNLLCYAASYNKLEILKYLIEKIKVDPMQADEVRRWIPLMYAI